MLCCAIEYRLRNTALMPTAPVTITRREWLRVLLFAALLLLVVSLPYGLAWARQGPDDVFSGFLFGADDGNSYLGKMRLGAQGSWDFYLFYTAEEHDSAGLLFLPYILPGQIVGLFMDSTDPNLTGVLLGVFHLMRIVFGALLIGTMYRFIAVFIESPGLRLLALALAAVGGGFGWLLIVTGADSPPPEFFIPEGFSLQILLGLPHLALARSALLAGLLLVIHGLNDPRWPLWSALAGACWLVVGLAVPFYLVVIACILGAWGLAAWIRLRRFPWRLFRSAALAAGLTLPLLLYTIWVFSRNPAFAQWSAQNLLESPPPLHYLLAYLPLILLAIPGVRRVWRAGETSTLLLVGWPVIVPLLVYLPINVQRRLAEAVIVPLAILAALGAGALAQRIAPRVGLTLLLAAVLPTSLILLAGAYLTALTGPPQVVYPAGQIAAFNWLNQQASAGAVVLSAFETGNRIPAYTNLRVYVGHGPETLDAVFKTAETERYYSGQMSAAERAALYAAMRIRYVFFGPAERALAGEAALSWQDDLTRIYQAGDYTIFRVPDKAADGD
jgi:hypothetical protein